MYTPTHFPLLAAYRFPPGATIFVVNLWDRMTGKYHPEQALGLSSMFPMNAVNLVAGDLHTVGHVEQLGHCGYDGIVIGRRIVDVPDLHHLVNAVHAFRGSPRDFAMTLGMKALPHTLQQDLDPEE